MLHSSCVKTETHSLELELDPKTVLYTRAHLLGELEQRARGAATEMHERQAMSRGDSDRAVTLAFVRARAFDQPCS